MGDFSISCGVSGTSMINTNVAIIPIHPNRFESTKGYLNPQGNIHVISNSGSSALFAPFTFPIFGTLDSYGSIEDIERDENVKCIEAYYGMPIQNFVDGLCPCTDLNIDYKVQYPCAMLVHREIYDLLSDAVKLQDDYGTKKNNYYMVDYDGRPLVNKINSQLAKVADALEKYDGPIDLVDYYRIGDNKWDKVKGDPVAREKLENMSMAILAITFGSSYYISFPPNLQEEQTHFVNLYRSLLKNKKATPFVYQFTTFMHAMYGVNRMFFPTFSGPQYGNLYLEKILHRKTIEIINKRLKKENED